jgi:hypothetical protein
MSILNQIAYFQDRRDEVPNQELARRLVESQDQAGVQEIAANLWHENPNVQSDCIKVLYEVGYLDPLLIVLYAGDFLKLLRSRHNRLVWGGMIALSTIAGLAADVIDPQRAAIQRAMAQGSVITVDAGVLTLAKLASTSTQRRQEIFPYLLEHLRSCRPKDVPQHAEKTALAVDASNRDEFIRTLEARLPHMSASQAARIRRVIKQVGAIS